MDTSQQVSYILIVSRIGVVVSSLAGLYKENAYGGGGGKKSEAQINSVVESQVNT